MRKYKGKYKVVLRIQKSKKYYEEIIECEKVDYSIAKFFFDRISKEISESGLFIDRNYELELLKDGV